MRERMVAGRLYRGDDPDLVVEYAAGQALQERFNATGQVEAAERDALLRRLFGAVGPRVVVRPPVFVDYGWNVSVGEGTFINVDAVLLDVAPIRIGAWCQLGPRVQLLTATHPLDPMDRRSGWESGAPIVLGDDVWLGAGVIVCPGVTIGGGSVVGAGAVVTRDLPDRVVAVGNPARVLRPVDPGDVVALPPG